MAFELPPLAYDYEALQPFMSKETLEYHHDKHHKAYVDNGNKLAAEAGMDGLSLEEIVKQSFGKNAGLFNNAGQHYNHIHFWKWMKKGGGGNKLPGALQKASTRSRRLRQVQGRFHRRRHDAVRLGLGLALGQERQARNLQDPERREPAGPWRQADPRRRRVGALLLHRLPQRPPEISRSLRRQPDQLGLCPGNVRRNMRPAVAMRRSPLRLPMQLRLAQQWAASASLVAAATRSTGSRNKRRPP
jgi:hypothetical protein